MPANDSNPFVGPRPLERADVERTEGKVPGRDKDVRDLHWRFTAERILWLHGPSGAGKTSLLQAGLIPKLEEKNRFHILPTIRLNTCPTGAGNRYTSSLLASLKATGSIKDAIAPQGDTRCRVLIFDQFEEVLTLVPNDGPDKEEFFKQLAHVLILPQVWALFIVREDYLPAFSHLARFLPTGMNHRFRLDLLSCVDACNAIEAIAATSEHREFLPDASQLLASRLARVPDVLTGKWVAGPTVEPVLLQVVCRTLWAKLDKLEKLDKSKTIITKITTDHIPKEEEFDEVLPPFYNDCLNARSVKDLRCDERRIREWIEKNLVAGGVRNIVLESAITAEDLPVDVLKALVNTHLLRRESGSHTWFELAHDRLIEPVRAGNREWKEQHLNWFQKRAAVWELKQKTQQFLLSDAELAEAESWIQQTSPVLASIETEFLRASRDARRSRAERRFWIRTAWVSAVGLAIALALAMLFKYQAETRELISQSRRIPRELETVGCVVNKGKEALDKSRWLDAGLRRDAMEALNEALQRGPAFHGSSGTELRAFFYTANRLAIVTDGSFTLIEIPGPLGADRKTLSSWSLTAFPGAEKPCSINSSALAADGESALIGLSDGSVRPLDLLKEVGTIPCAKPGDAVQALTRIGGADAVARASGSLEIDRIAVNYSGRIETLAFHPDGKRLAVGTKDGTIDIITRSGPTGQSLKADKPQPITTLAWTNGGLIAGSNTRGTFRFWDPSLILFQDFTHTPVNSLGIVSAAISPDGAHVATAGDTTDRLVKVWPTAGAGAPFVFPTPPEDEGKLVSVAFLDDTRLLVATNKGGVRLYHLTPSALREAADFTIKQSPCPGPK